MKYKKNHIAKVKDIIVGFEEFKKKIWDIDYIHNKKDFFEIFSHSKYYKDFNYFFYSY